MVYYVIALLVASLLDVLTVCLKADSDKDLEIMVLRHQVRILHRKVDKTPRLSRSEKLILALLVNKFKTGVKGVRSRLNEALLLFKPDTILKWHRELVKRKWTFKPDPGVGRPRTVPGLEALVIRLAQENPRWGADRIHGELKKLGFDLGPTTVRAILARHGIPPAPERSKRGNSWRHLLAHDKDQILACDFFTVETVRFQTLYVLFFLDVGSRRVYLSGCTSHPTSTWVTQQARQLVWSLTDEHSPKRFLIHDRDTKFTRSFDVMFNSEGIDILLTPFQAPNANAFAERWVRSVRQECLDHILIVDEWHLQRVLKEYIDHYNIERPHQGLAQQTPMPYPPNCLSGPIQRREILGGIIHEYYPAAA